MANILVIDDDENLRKLVRRALGNEHHLKEVDNGEDGLAYAFAQLPELVLCDITMPDIDGYTVLGSLRNNEATASTSFIFLTALDTRESMRQGMTQGADDFLVKPFSLDELRAAVQASLRKRSIHEAELERKVDEVRQTISIALPHELRTAIMVIEGYTHLMLDDSMKFCCDHTDMLNELRQSTIRLHRLADKFLWYAKTHTIDPKKMHMQYTADPEASISFITSLKASQASRSNDLVLDLAIEERPIQMPEEYLTKVIEEIMENALKFSPTGSEIVITSEIENNCYLIQIIDHGRGFLPNQIAKVGAFVQFEREQFEQQGTGLGLGIAKRFAELFGGSLSIASKPMEKTVVSIRLPCR